MKLLSQYNKIYIPAIVAILLVGSLGYYFILRYTLVHQLDKDLRVEQQEILEHVKQTGQLPAPTNFKGQIVEFVLTDRRVFNDNLYTEKGFEKPDGEVISLRRLDFLVMQNGSNFIASVKKSEQETEDIIQLILLITISLIVVLFIVLFLINRFLLSSLWRPFYHSLKQLKEFDVIAGNLLKPQQTKITEFEELQESISSMEKKVIGDYRALKTFTENASHEIQTPLAIIKNKIELLLQVENLNEAQVKAVESLNEAVSRISKLNSSLLLLTKVENNGFQNLKEINFSQMLSRRIDDLEELAAVKRIEIEKRIARNIFLEINESLSEILISNLLVNAIKHNVENGKIFIDLNLISFTIANTGRQPEFPTTELFERFKKGSSSSDSIGLGLSLVKSICVANELSVAYNFKDGFHIVTVYFIKFKPEFENV